MKRYRPELNLPLILFALIALCGIAMAQQSPPQTETARPPVNQDPLGGLDLSPEQRQQIRAAMEGTKLDRNSANLRLRKAQLAYDEALDADNPSEEVIEQRAKEVGEAQAGLMRARAVLEIRIRRILTPQQRAELRNIRLTQREAQQLKRLEQRVQNQGNQNQRALPAQRNGIAPNRQIKRNGAPRNFLPKEPGF